MIKKIISWCWVVCSECALLVLSLSRAWLAHSLGLCLATRGLGGAASHSFPHLLALSLALRGSASAERGVGSECRLVTEEKKLKK